MKRFLRQALASAFTTHKVLLVVCDRDPAVPHFPVALAPVLLSTSTTSRLQWLSPLNQMLSKCKFGDVVVSVSPNLADLFTERPLLYAWPRSTIHEPDILNNSCSSSVLYSTGRSTASSVSRFVRGLSLKTSFHSHRLRCIRLQFSNRPTICEIYKLVLDVTRRLYNVNVNFEQHILSSCWRPFKLR